MDNHISFGAAAGFSVTVLLGFIAWTFTKPTSRHLLPPGPRPFPLIGNALDIPREKEWLTYHHLAQKYGDIVHLEAFGQHIVVLNSAKAVHDLFERRSAIYSSRPTAFMSGVLMGLQECNLGVRVYGEAWRNERRMLHSQMHSNAVSKFRGVQMRQTRLFLKHLLVHPGGVTDGVRGVVGATIMDAVYGIQVTGTTDPYITILYHFDQLFVTRHARRRREEISRDVTQHQPK